MAELELGPNGALLYCLEFLDKNTEWLTKQLTKFAGNYFLFDLPGQIELFLNNDSLRSICQKIKECKENQIHLTCVELFDSHFCYDPHKFISACLLATISMTNLELPHLNVLSKMDLLKNYDDLPRPLKFFTET